MDVILWDRGNAGALIAWAGCLLYASLRVATAPLRREPYSQSLCYARTQNRFYHHPNRPQSVWFHHLKS